MAILFNRFGTFLGCSRYPDCKNTLNLTGRPKAEAELTEFTCRARDKDNNVCGRPMEKKVNRWGSPFLACTGFKEGACKGSVSLSKAGLPFDRVDGTLTLVGGRLSARNVVVDSARAEIFGSGEVDLRSYDLDADFSLKIDPGEDAVTGAEPQVGLLFEGPVDAPERRVDIAPFTAYLTLRAFEQEVERVEKLQAEILERDRLVRELKRQRQASDRRASGSWYVA